MEGFVPLPTLSFSTSLGLQNETFFFFFLKLFILLDAQIFGTAALCCLRSLLGTAGAAWDRLLARASWLWGCSQPGWVAAQDAWPSACFALGLREGGEYPPTFGDHKVSRVFCPRKELSCSSCLQLWQLCRRVAELSEH